MADLAGVLYQLALAAAAGAGLLGLHYAKGGALLADDKAASAAVRAGLGASTGGAAGAVTLGALLLTGDGNVLLAAVHGLVKAQGDAHPDVLTLAGGVGICLTGRAAEAAKAAAEDIAKNVAQVHTVAAKTAEAAGAAAVLCCVGGVNSGKAVLVVQLALFRVRKHLVCFVDLLELCLGVLIAGVIVRVVLHGKLAVCLFDLGIACALGYPQHFVIITLFLCHIHSPLRERPPRVTPRSVPPVQKLPLWSFAAVVCALIRHAASRHATFPRPGEGFCGSENSFTYKPARAAPA